MTLDRHRSGLCVGQLLGSFEGGGAQRLAYNLAVGAAARGVRSLAIAVRHPGEYTDHHPPQIEVVSLDAANCGIVGTVRAALKLRRVVKSERIDVLHVHGSISLPFVALALAGLRHRVKIVFTWQDSEAVLSQTGWRQRRMIWAIRRCDLVSGASRSIVERLTAGAKLPNVGIFHGGVPITPLTPGESQSPPSIIWVGRVVPPKDPEALIRASAALRDDGCECSTVLVGAPTNSTKWYFDRARLLIDSWHLADRVRMPGFVADAEMPALYAAAQIGVQTSHTEGLSIALMEQMMAGLAIVATDVGDTSMAIQHEVNGLLIPPRDDKALISALRRLIHDVPLRGRLASAARQTAIERYSLEAMTSRALAEYEAVTKHR